jgi:hypothetical protein
MIKMAALLMKKQLYQLPYCVITLSKLERFTSAD